MQKLVLPVALAAILIALHAIPQGIWSRRWGQRDVTEEQKAFAARLENIPTSFGDWDSVAMKVSDRELEASGSIGSFSRRFQNRISPEKIVQVFIVCGNSYDVTMHTPDQCYVLSGFEETETPQPYVVPGKVASEFTTNRFRRSSTLDGPQHLRIFWSFSSDGEWVAPSTPKFSLMSAPALYKIYAITEVVGDNGTRAGESPAVPFLQEFMPLLSSALFPANATKPSVQEDTAVPVPVTGDSLAPATGGALPAAK
jgi:hypothetical protein